MTSFQKNQAGLDLSRENVNEYMDNTQQYPTILIVDDEFTELQILANLLKGEYSVLIAMSGREALRVVEQQRPDLILLDIKLADSDGFSICGQLKEDELFKDIPIIFITSLNDVDSELKGLEVGAVDYITKPIQPSILINRVRNHLKLKIQRDFLRRVTIIDGLTKIANRRGFDRALEREWYRAMNHHLPLSLIMADIDHFKDYNDRYGHPCGDECLRVIAKVFHEHMHRLGDLAARYGGEEFVCLLPDTDSLGAQGAARSMMAAINALAIPHENSPIATVLTVSIGVATATPGTTDSQHDLLALVDGCLYEAKNSGKNRINFQSSI